MPHVSKQVIGFIAINKFTYVHLSQSTADVTVYHCTLRPGKVDLQFIINNRITPTKHYHLYSNLHNDYFIPILTDFLILNDLIILFQKCK